MMGDMTLSNHRRIELHALAAGKEPESGRVMSGCVVLRYPGLGVLFSRRIRMLTMPGRDAEAEYLDALGVGERGEGSQLERVPNPSVARLAAAREAKRLALA
jgi:hypothetical protein